MALSYTESMHLFHWIFGGLLGALWLSRLIDGAIGMPSVADITRPEWDLYPKGPASRVTVIVPARNEEECIEQCLSSLLEQDYADYEIIAVNDRSTDKTGEVMDRLAEAESGKQCLRILHVAELPPRWLGKTHAMWTAASQATGDWILFTDGDIVFREDTLRRSVTYAQASGADHLVLYPTMIMKTFGERMMISFFQIMFVFANRAWKVADPKAHDFIGVGAFNMVRRSTYESIGSYEALRLTVIDDMFLGRLVKAKGFAQRNVFGRDLISLRWAKGAMGVVGNLNKNFFALMRFNWAISLLAAVLLAVVNIGPFAGLLAATGWSKAGYAVALLSIALLYVGMSSKSQVSPMYFVWHPVSTILVIYTLMRSTWAVLANDGITWRGTHYSLSELKKSL